MKNWSKLGLPTDMADRHALYRGALLEAGEIEFTLHGFSAAKNYAIAARAEVSPATLKRFFVGKTALWNGIHESRAAELSAALRQNPRDVSPEVQILEASRIVALYLASAPTYLDLQISSGVNWATADVTVVGRGHGQQTSWTLGTELLVNGVCEARRSGLLVDLRPELIASIVISTLQAWLCDWVLLGRNQAPDEMAESMVNYLRRLIVRACPDVEPGSQV